MSSGITDKWVLKGDKVVVDEAAPKYDPSTVEVDPTNTDSTDWPRRGCQLCGKRDRPQFKGICNDGHCGV